jgi:hypothetical protein
VAAALPSRRHAHRRRAHAPVLMMMPLRQP